jgi:hypothetical protein
MTKKDPRRQQPLPLEKLSRWVSPSGNTLDWLQEGDEKAAAMQEELDAHGTAAIVNLFSDKKYDNDDDDCDSIDSNDSTMDSEGICGRLRVWSSSTTNINGIGSNYSATTDEELQQYDVGSSKVRVIYLISESWQGYGDILWASARHLGNQFAGTQKIF